MIISVKVGVDVQVEREGGHRGVEGTHATEHAIHLGLVIEVAHAIDPKGTTSVRERLYKAHSHLALPEDLWLARGKNGALEVHCLALLPPVREDSRFRVVLELVPRHLA